MEQQPSGQYVIPLSKTKVSLILLGSITFVAISFWLWTTAAQQTQRDPLTVKIVALIGAGFFGLCGILAAVKLFDRKPGLIIDPEGIIDNSSGVSAGRIRWQEVRSIRVTSVARQRFLTLEVEDPMKYISRGNFFKRTMNLANSKFFGSPIQISANTLQIDFNELLNVIGEFYERHRRA